MRRTLVVLLLILGCGLTGQGGISTAPAASRAPSPHNPVGNLDGVSVRLGPATVFSGWAADPDTPGQPVDVRILVDGKLYGTVLTGRPRPDVAAVHQWAGGSTGWTIDVDRTLVRQLSPGSSQQICAWARNVGAGTGATRLGCDRPYQAGTASPASPFGVLERAVVSSGLVRVIGWAGDPDGPARSRLRITVEDGGQFDAFTTIARPDVRAATGLKLKSGFDVSVPVLPGWRYVAITIENSGPNGRDSPTFSTRAYTVPDVRPPRPHDPRGNLDHVTYAFAPPNGRSWGVVGWAYDPDQAGPVKVLFRAYTHGAVDRPDTGMTLRSLSTGLARPDVEPFHPGAGPNSGVAGHLVTTQSGGVWVVCAYAVNVGPGRNAFLGCTRDATAI